MFITSIPAFDKFDGVIQYGCKPDGTADVPKDSHGVLILLLIIIVNMTTENPPSLLTRLGQLSGTDYSKPLVDRLPLSTNSAGAGTPAIAPVVVADDKVRSAGYSALRDFPFTDEAKASLKDLKYKAADSFKGKDVQNVDGEFSTRGAGIYNAASTILPTTLSTWIATKASAFNAPKITISSSLKQDPEGVMSHEMLHDLFERSPMGDQQFVAGKKDPNVESQAGQAWISAWDKVKQSDTDIGPLLAHIDDHLAKSGYDTSNAYQVANERFAYLGQEALTKGINIIPKELQPYYYGVIKGAPKPTPEQLGVGLPTSDSFNIDIGGPLKTDIVPKSRSDILAPKAALSQRISDLNYKGQAPLTPEPRTVLDKITGRSTISRKAGDQQMTTDAQKQSGIFESLIPAGLKDKASSILDAVGQGAAAYGLDAKTLYNTLISENSKFDPTAQNKGGDQGLFQVNKTNLPAVTKALQKDFGIAYDWKNPEHSALAASVVLSGMQKTLGKAGIKDLSPQDLSVAYRMGANGYSIATTSKTLEGKKATPEQVKTFKKQYQQRTADLSKRQSEWSTI